MAVSVVGRNGLPDAGAEWKVDRYPPEIMPLAFRAKGTSFSTATNWAFNYIVGEATPILQEKIKWRLYFMHAFFCLVSFFLVYFCYPETMGVPLEVSHAFWPPLLSRTER